MGRKQCRGDRADIRLRDHQLEREAAANYTEQRHHQRFDVAETLVLQIKHGQHIQGSNAYAGYDRDSE